MKISYNWLKAYINTNKSVEEVSAILTDTGLEVEGVEKIGGNDQLDGLVIGEVVECEQHPNADRLKLTKVDLGSDEPVQIVCGAPNVAKGQKVCVATVGTTLFPTDGDSFKIKKGKIRGEVSMGMICAEDEIGLGKSHDGIMVLDTDLKAGSSFSEYLDLEEDYTIEIGLTPNRADAFSHIGVARDLAAALNFMEGIENENAKLNWPDTSSFKVDNRDLNIPVKVENTEACPRYCGLTISGLRVEASPEWLQNRLKAIGLSPINNVVDITNFVCHEMGQPLHAFDADKIKGSEVIVKCLPNGTKFTTLDENERELNENDLMICDTEGGMCIAGVFGGIHSGVSDSTSKIFLESAYFNSVYIRKTARRHVLNTDASFRFERGVDPNITVEALKRAALLIKEVAGGEISSDIFDSNPEGSPDFKVELSLNRLSKLIGVDIPKDKVISILASLDIRVDKDNGDELSLSVSPYRVDVQREADVIEEVLRIYGFNTVPVPSRLRSSLSFAPKPDLEKLRYQISGVLAGAGLTEIMSNSLTKSEYKEFASDEAPAVDILNPLSTELGIMRQNLLFGGLEAIARNINHKNDNLHMFEFGKKYFKTGDSYGESMSLGVFLSGNRLPENWNNSSETVRFQDLRAVFDKILQALRINAKLKCNASNSGYFSEGMDFSIGKECVAKLGYVNSSILKHFDIKQKVLYADISWDTMMKYLPKASLKTNEIEKYPAVRRDLSLLLDKSVQFADIETAAFKAEKQLLREVGLFDVYEGEKLDANKKSYALSFILQDSEKTLNDKQIEAAMGRITKGITDQFDAELRG